MLSNHIKSVTHCLLNSKWDHHNQKYKKFIGDMGKIAVVPGRPHEWYPLIKKVMKSTWYCSEHGIDWWFQPIRGISKRSGHVFCGVEVIVTQEMMDMIQRTTPQRIKPDLDKLFIFLSSAVFNSNRIV
jgi:hypothetical protein|tara:strand:+ start:7381 stop:7764 length:384 start_codon:yes stop_codon:yes gene_type:complete